MQNVSIKKKKWNAGNMESSDGETERMKSHKNILLCVSGYVCYVI